MSQEFIGKGERTVVEVLKIMTHLPELISRFNKFGEPGIYTQVKIKDLIPASFFNELAEPQQKSSVDVVLLTKKGDVLCYRVQNGTTKKNTHHGHTGLHKHKFDVVQSNFLQDAGCHVVDIHEWECSNVFKEEINFMSFFEITDAMYRNNIIPSMFKEKRGKKRG